MKNRLGNLILKLLLKADADLLEKFYDKTKSISQNSKYKKFREKYDISKSFRFNGDSILFYGRGSIEIGENSYIGNFSTIQAYDGCKVRIGNNCSISHNVRIYTSSNKSEQDFNKDGIKEKVFGNVIIGDGVWIGANVFIRQNVVIKDNVIVGANSVVTKNLKKNGIYAGVPAKLIKYKF